MNVNPVNKVELFIFKGNDYKHCIYLRETKGVNTSSLIMQLKMNG